MGVNYDTLQKYFGTRAELLTAIVMQGYKELALAMTQAVFVGTDCKGHRRLALLAYVEFAEKSPALYALMFAHDSILTDDPDLVTEIRACYVIFTYIFEGLGWYQADGNASKTTQDVRNQAALWSLVHGFVQLRSANKLKTDAMANLSILDILPSL